MGTDLAGGRVLVVDDDRVNRMLLTRSLERDGHRVRCAENGAEALEVLHDDPCDVVLLDIVMPELDRVSVLVHVGRFAVVAALISLLPAACGGGDSGEEPTAAPGAEAGDPATDAADMATGGTIRGSASILGRPHRRTRVHVGGCCLPIPLGSCWCRRYWRGRSSVEAADKERRWHVVACGAGLEAA
jgi:Response regulator receiver domain